MIPHTKQTEEIALARRVCHSGAHFCTETAQIRLKYAYLSQPALAQSLLASLVMMNNSSSMERPQARTCYANALRCIGQSLEALELKAVEVKTHGENYIIQAWNKGTSIAMDLERHCSPEELKKLEIAGRENRKTPSAPPNLLSLSQVLRLAGNYVDRLRGRLIRVSWQDQSDKIQAITIQYEPWPVNRKDSGEAQITVIEEVCVHVYKQRKKIAAPQDKGAQRPFVSVNLN